MGDWADEEAKRVIDCAAGMSTMRKGLAAALRKARADALEEAALACEAEVNRIWEEEHEPADHGWAELIRDLKDKP